MQPRELGLVEDQLRAQGESDGGRGAASACVAVLDCAETLKWEAESLQLVGRSHRSNKDDPASTVTECATEEAR